MTTAARLNDRAVALVLPCNRAGVTPWRYEVSIGPSAPKPKPYTNCPIDATTTPATGAPVAAKAITANPPASNTREPDTVAGIPMRWLSDSDTDVPSTAPTPPAAKLTPSATAPEPQLPQGERHVDGGGDRVEQEPPVGRQGEWAKRGMTVYPTSALSKLLKNRSPRPTWRRLRDTARGDEQTGQRIAHSVQSNSQRRPDPRHQGAAHYWAGGLSYRCALFKASVCARQQRARHQHRQEGLLSGRAQYRQRAEQRHQHCQCRDRQVTDTRQHRHSREYHRSPQIGADQDRLTPNPIDQHTYEQSEHQIRNHGRAAHKPDLSRGAVKIGNDQNTQCHCGDRGTEVRDRACSPKAAEPQVIAQTRIPPHQLSRSTTKRG